MKNREAAIAAIRTCKTRESLLGIFTILDKNEFYHNKTIPFRHKFPDEVLQDFYLLENRNNGKLNLS